MNFLKSMCAAVALAAFAAPASAALVDVTAQNSGSVFKDAAGNNAWYIGTSFEVATAPTPTTRNNIAAGVFRMTGDDGVNPVFDFLAFCLQPLEWLSIPKTYDMSSGLSAQVIDNLNALAGNAFGLVQDSNSAAAFQMAVWEIANETGGYDIRDGYFKITGGTTASNNAEDLANTWLGNIASNTWQANGASFMILSAPGTQDLLTNLPGGNLGSVPIPASGLLLLGALAGGGAMARRKARKAA